MTLAMNEHERQEFLAGVHIGIISIERNLKFSMRPTRWWSVDYT